MRISDWSSDVCSSDLDYQRSLCADAGRSAGGCPRLCRKSSGQAAQVQSRQASRLLRKADHIAPREQLCGLGQGPECEIGGADVSTPVTNVHIVCRLLLEIIKKLHIQHTRT